MPLCLYQNIMLFWLKFQSRLKKNKIKIICVQTFYGELYFNYYYVSKGTWAQNNPSAQSNITINKGQSKNPATLLPGSILVAWICMSGFQRNNKKKRIMNDLSNCLKRWILRPESNLNFLRSNLRHKHGPSGLHCCCL